MQAQTHTVKAVIKNVVCTADLKQKVNVENFNMYGWGIYDMAIYGGRCGYVKPPDMIGRVTVFPSGKMISLGAKSVKQAIEQLQQAKFYLVREKFIEETKLQEHVQNIVATLNLNQKLPFKKIVPKLKGSIYEPETFPAIIYRTVRSLNYLIFASGKILINGAKSENELNEASFEIQQQIALASK